MELMMNINFYSAYYLTIDLLPDMLKNKQGHIFNICSVASLKAYDGGGSYSVSKFALHGFSMNLRHELKNKGIKVTTVFPGATYTDTWGDFNNSNNRIMEADDIAKMILSATELSSQAVVEEILIRPQLGDL
jgi:short-subunit dehydrogenase